MNVDVNKESDSSAGYAYIDTREVETARLILARATGTPEHVLYDDPSPILYNKDEGKLNEMIELQERMATGMLSINECDAALNHFNDGHWVPRDVFMGWVNRKKDLWAFWHVLKAECGTLAKEDPSIWPKYFKLKNSEEDVSYDPRAHKKDSPDIDNRMLTSDEAFFEGHMEEQQEFFSYNRE